MQAQLRHRHVVPILGVKLDAEPPWFVMPKADMSLRDYLKKHGGGDANVWMVQEIAHGLQHAHENGVIHRDLKPENILLFSGEDEGRYVAVSDFGLGRLISRDSPSLTETNVRMGTVEYMAPEQYRDAKHADHLSDVYSLGKILYEVLTGEVPYPEMDMGRVPRKYAYVIQKACERERERRYQSVQDFLNDLNAIADEEELLSRPAEAIRNEIQRILETQDFGAQNVERLVRLFNENTDDTSVLTDMLPKLPDPILKGLLRDHESGMLPVLRAYDNEVSGDLPFEYCDVVANFYAKIFRWARSDEPKLIVLRRLPPLGYSHNRWHVGTVFGELVRGLTDPSLIMAVRDILRDNPESAEWCKPYLEKQSLPSAIRSVLRNLPSSSEARDDAPF